MRKIVPLLLLLTVVSVWPNFGLRASASPLEDKLVELAAQQPIMQQVDELLTIRNEVKKLGQTDMVVLLAQNALAQSGLPVGEQIKPDKIIEQAVRKEVEKSFNGYLDQYQNEIAAISTLLSVNSTLTPETSKDSNSLAGAPANYSRIIDMTATAYGPGPLDNGKWNDLTYMGGKVKYGVVAVDPSVIPMGSKLWIEGYGMAIAEDQGSAIKGNRIDLAFNTRSEALAYGIQKVKVYVLK